MAVLEQITPISAATKAEIERLGAAGLPDNPSEEGMTTEEIKRAFYEPLNRAIDEINRIVSEANQLFSGQAEGLTSHLEDKENPHEVTAEQIPYGDGTVEEALEALEADGSVTTDKLEDGAVTTDKIENGAVTSDKIADDVPQSKIEGLTTDYFADVTQDGSVLSFLDKSGNVKKTAAFGGALRRVAENDRDRGGTTGTFTFSMTAGKKYLVAVFGETNIAFTISSTIYYNVNVNDVFFVKSGVSQNLTHYAYISSFHDASAEIQLGSVSGNTLTISNWQYYNGSTPTPGARHIVVFEIV